MQAQSSYAFKKQPTVHIHVLAEIRGEEPGTELLSSLVCGLLGEVKWEGGFFDRGSFMETLGNWAQTVVTGRARLGGIPCGVIAVETRSVDCIIPADPANPDTESRVSRTCCLLCCLFTVLFVFTVMFVVCLLLRPSVRRGRCGTRTQPSRQHRQLVTWTERGCPFSSSLIGEASQEE